MTLPTTEKETLTKEKYKLDQIITLFDELHELNPENNHWKMWSENIKVYSKGKGRDLKETVKLENDSKKVAKLKTKWADTFKKITEHFKVKELE